jgi:hypothetical protein
VVVKVKGKKQAIMDVCQGCGSEHDFSLYKRTIGNTMHAAIPAYVDLGYLGIEQFHTKSKVPKKSSKLRKLTEKDKAYNKRLAQKRVIVEHINAKIKTFKILAHPYRNRLKRHLLRMSLICGIINLELRK